MGQIQTPLGRGVKHLDFVAIQIVTLLLLLLLLLLLSFHSRVGDMRWRRWLSHCTTSRKVAGSIPDGVIKISH